MFKGRRESAGSVYIRCSTQFSPANSAESVRSLSASLHSVTGECNWRKSNPYWLRWPSPDCIWRSDGTCSLLSGGTEIAVWVTVIREKRLRAKASESGNWAQNRKQNTDKRERNKTNANKPQEPKATQTKNTKHTKTKTNKKRTRGMQSPKHSWDRGGIACRTVIVLEEWVQMEATASYIV